MKKIISKPNAMTGLAKINLFPVPNGKYIVHSTVNPKYVWDVNVENSNLIVWQKSVNPNQQFIFEENNSGLYTINCAHTGKVIDCAGGKIDNLTNVRAYDPNGTNAQLWSIHSEGDGKYSFKCALDGTDNNRLIGLQDALVKNGSNIWLYNANGTNAQKWTLESIQSINIEE